jgi:hypothetical protein
VNDHPANEPNLRRLIIDTPDLPSTGTCEYYSRMCDFTYTPPSDDTEDTTSGDDKVGIPPSDGKDGSTTTSTTTTTTTTSTTTSAPTTKKNGSKYDDEDNESFLLDDSEEEDDSEWYLQTWFIALVVGLFATCIICTIGTCYIKKWKESKDLEKLNQAREMKQNQVDLEGGDDTFVIGEDDAYNTANKNKSGEQVIPPPPQYARGVVGVPLSPSSNADSIGRMATDVSDMELGAPYGRFGGAGYKMDNSDLDSITTENSFDMCSTSNSSRNNSRPASRKGSGDLSQKYAHAINPFDSPSTGGVVLETNQDLKKKETFIDNLNKELPMNWRAAVDPKTNRPYYWNTITLKSQWRKPKHDDANVLKNTKKSVVIKDFQQKKRLSTLSETSIASDSTFGMIRKKNFLEKKGAELDADDKKRSTRKGQKMTKEDEELKDRAMNWWA